MTSHSDAEDDTRVTGVRKRTRQRRRTASAGVRFVDGTTPKNSDVFHGSAVFEANNNDDVKSTESHVSMVTVVESNDSFATVGASSASPATDDNKVIFASGFEIVASGSITANTKKKLQVLPRLNTNSSSSSSSIASSISNRSGVAKKNLRVGFKDGVGGAIRATRPARAVRNVGVTGGDKAFFDRAAIYGALGAPKTRSTALMAGAFNGDDFSAAREGARPKADVDATLPPMRGRRRRCSTQRQNVICLGAKDSSLYAPFLNESAARKRSQPASRFSIFAPLLAARMRERRYLESLCLQSAARPDINNNSKLGSNDDVSNDCSIDGSKGNERNVLHATYSGDTDSGRVRDNVGRVGEDPGRVGTDTGHVRDNSGCADTGCVGEVSGSGSGRNSNVFSMQKTFLENGADSRRDHSVSSDSRSVAIEGQSLRSRALANSISESEKARSVVMTRNDVDQIIGENQLFSLGSGWSRRKKTETDKHDRDDRLGGSGISDGSDRTGGSSGSGGKTKDAFKDDERKREESRDVELGPMLYDERDINNSKGSKRGPAIDKRRSNHSRDKNNGARSSSKRDGKVENKSNTSACAQLDALRIDERRDVSRDGGRSSMTPCQFENEDALSGHRRLSNERSKAIQNEQYHLDGFGLSGRRKVSRQNSRIVSVNSNFRDSNESFPASNPSSRTSLGSRETLATGHKVGKSKKDGKGHAIGGNLHGVSSNRRSNRDKTSKKIDQDLEYESDSLGKPLPYHSVIVDEIEEEAHEEEEKKKKRRSEEKRRREEEGEGRRKSSEDWTRVGEEREERRRGRGLSREESGRRRSKEEIRRRKVREDGEKRKKSREVVGQRPRRKGSSESSSSEEGGQLRPGVFSAREIDEDVAALTRFSPNRNVDQNLAVPQYGTSWSQRDREEIRRTSGESSRESKWSLSRPFEFVRSTLAKALSALYAMEEEDEKEEENDQRSYNWRCSKSSSAGILKSPNRRESSPSEMSRHVFISENLSQEEAASPFGESKNERLPDNSGSITVFFEEETPSLSTTCSVEIIPEELSSKRRYFTHKTTPISDLQDGNYTKYNVVGKPADEPNKSSSKPSAPPRGASKASAASEGKKKSLLSSPSTKPTSDSLRSQPRTDSKLPRLKSKDGEATDSHAHSRSTTKNLDSNYQARSGPAFSKDMASLDSGGSQSLDPSNGAACFNREVTKNKARLDSIDESKGTCKNFRSSERVMDEKIDETCNAGSPRASNSSDFTVYSENGWLPGEEPRWRTSIGYPPLAYNWGRFFSEMKFLDKNYILSAIEAWSYFGYDSDFFKTWHYHGVVSPFYDRLEANYRVPRETMTSLIIITIVIVLGIMGDSVPADEVVTVLGILYPIYGTVQMLDRPTAETFDHWVGYWIAFYLLCIENGPFDFLTYWWMPFRQVFKLLLLFWLMIPRRARPQRRPLPSPSMAIHSTMGAAEYLRDEYVLKLTAQAIEQFEAPPEVVPPPREEPPEEPPRKGPGFRFKGGGTLCAAFVMSCFYVYLERFH